jgi:hypothetical protein
LGAGSISLDGISSTACTESTTTPMFWRSPSASRDLDDDDAGALGHRRGRLAKAADKSITGTTAPRRLMTPRMHAGIIGTSVRLAYQMISLMHRMPAKTSRHPA